MSTDVITQLEQYFAWLEDDAGVSFRPVPTAIASGARPPASTAVKVARRGRRGSSARFVAVAAAAAALIATILVISRHDPASVPPSGQTPAPTESSSPPPTAAVDEIAPGTAEALPPSPLAGRSDMVEVWTGTEMLVWGGDSTDGTPTYFNDGAAYDPATRTWTMLPASPLSPHADPAAVWTGHELLVYGGGDASGQSFSDGAAYNPAAGTWRTISPHTMSATVKPAFVWTGTEMIVLAGINGDDRAAAYNPRTNAWRPIADAPGRPVPADPQAVWTGDLLIAVLSPGKTFDDVAPVLAAYSATSDSWSTLAGAPKVFGRLVWTGTSLLVFGGPSSSAAWTESTGSWRTFGTPPGLPPTAHPTWVGDQAVFWTGGSTAYAYDPARDIWRSFGAGGLRPRLESPHVSTGSLFLSWGGWSDASGQRISDGIALRPPDPEASGGQSVPAVTGDTIGAGTVSPTVPSLESTNAEPTDVIGELQIPSIALDFDVFDGAGKSQEAQGVGHDAQTALPGSTGNAVLVGERLTHLHPFYDLDKLKAGDQIDYTPSDSPTPFVYRVTDTAVVDPTDLAAAYQATTTPTLTLVTCTPIGTTSHRLVVHATLDASSSPTPIAAPTAPAVTTPSSTWDCNMQAS